MEFIVKKEVDLTIPEDKIVNAKVAEIVKRVMRWKDRDTGQDRERDMLCFYFEVTDGEYAGKKVRKEVPAELGTGVNNPFRILVVTLLGREIVEGMALSVTDLLHLPARITIKHKPGKEGRVYEEVDEVMPSGDSNGFSFSGAQPAMDQPPF